MLFSDICKRLTKKISIFLVFFGNSTISKIFSFLFKVPNDSTISSFPLFPVGHNYYLFLYYYSFSIHFRDHLAIILNVTVGFLSLLYLVLFTPIVLISFLLGPFCQLSPRRRLFKLCTRRVYNLYIHIVHKIADLTTKIKLFLLISIFFLPNKFAHIKYLLYLCSRKF